MNKIALSFLLIRFLSTLVIQTWFVPDEYYQVTEVAHHWVFGYGSITWEWKEGIRSILYPGIIAAFYKILDICNLDYRFLLIHIPRLFSAALFSVGDYQIWKLSKTLYGDDSAAWTAVCVSSCWFLSYCAPRTLSSSVEMVFIALALSCFPWNHMTQSTSVKYLMWTGIGCVMRPTAAILVVPLFVYHVFCCQRKIIFLFKTSITIALILAASIGLDSVYYGKLTIVPLRFFEVNTIEGISEHYGSHPWHWYFTLGLPSTLGSHLIPIFLGVCSDVKRYTSLLVPIFFSIIVHSFVSHKEFRFLLPTLPLLLVIGGDFVSQHLNNYSKKTDHPTAIRSMIFLIMLIVPSVLALTYLGLIHQRGPLDLMTALTSLIAASSHPNLLFLTPCHSTPLYSFLHQNITVRSLTCEPNLLGIPNYVDESDRFFSHPAHWLHSNYIEKDASHLVKGPPKMCEFYVEKTSSRVIQSSQSQDAHYHALKKNYPSHVIMFDNLEQSVQQFLEICNYKLCQKIFNAHINDGRKGKYFHIFCK